jgi:hypothetical protein
VYTGIRFIPPLNAIFDQKQDALPPLEHFIEHLMGIPQNYQNLKIKIKKKSIKDCPKKG